MISNENIHEVLKKVKNAINYRPYVETHKFNPFRVLISTILSSRTKDEVTRQASKKLFSKVKNPYDLSRLSEKQIEKLIYPVGFYRVKAKLLKRLAKVLVTKYKGKIPDTMEELLKLPGVGRKTANLVLTLGFNKYGICVDTHVHRIVNRWGYVSTRSPNETEMELRKKLPKKYWKEINGLLVSFGRSICKPVAPLCNECPLRDLCPKIGVKKHR